MDTTYANLLASYTGDTIAFSDNHIHLDLHEISDIFASDQAQDLISNPEVNNLSFAQAFPGISNVDCSIGSNGNPYCV